MANSLFRNFLASRYRPPAITDSGPLANVLAGQDTFFSGPGNGPEYDYPNPRGRAFPQELRTFICALPLALLAAALPPVQQHSPPNPAAKPFPQDQRGYVQSSPIQLAGRDQFFAAAGQGPAYDYPNPRGRQHPTDLRTTAQSASPGLLAAASPVVSVFDYPNPRGRSLSQTWLANNTLILVPVVAVAPPVAVYDYPNPRTIPFPQALRTWVAPTPLHLAGQDRLFGAPGQASAFSYPNPRGRVIAAGIADQVQNIVALGSTPPPVPTTLTYLIALPSTGGILAITTTG